MLENQFLIEMKGIVKKFPGVLALDNVDFQLKAGEIHMLLGENGAGKSTLIKVLSGAHKLDGGQIYIEGKEVEFNSPQDPLDLGLRFIYQEVNLVPELDIARNMFLGVEPLKRGLVDSKKLYSETEKYLKKFHIDLKPKAIVGSLSVTQQKLVEIARALVTDAKVLVLDEPTDVLEDRSRNDLFEAIQDLKKHNNVGFIYISHRYQEVHDLGDRVTILRDGKNAGVHNICDITLDEMIEEMIGESVQKQYPELNKPEDVEVLRVENIRQGNKLNGITLSVKRGEIVSVTGLMGAGKTELARAVCGIDPIDDGVVFVEGKEVDFSSPEKSIAAGMAYLSEDRKGLGLILPHSIMDNYGLPNSPRLSKFGLINKKEIDREITGYMKALKVKAPSKNTKAGQLSGGNQQKAVIAKWLGTQSRVLLFDEPTRGIDILGRAGVYSLMNELLDQGIGILMLTSDYTEALEMGHKVVVLYRGQIKKVFKRGEATEEDILRAAIGSN
ncbi:MAG: sugar ABC transporter ATP-binding protein [Spirochaetaceae bacterium]